MGFKATYVQRGEAIDYTPSADVKAGDVVSLGSIVGIAKLDIKANELGALAVIGVYDIVKATGAVAIGDSIYWDAANGKATTTPTAIFVGVAVQAALSAGSTCQVLINVGYGVYVEESSSSSSSI